MQMSWPNNRLEAKILKITIELTKDCLCVAAWAGSWAWAAPPPSPRCPATPLWGAAGAPGDTGDMGGIRWVSIYQCHSHYLPVSKCSEDPFSTLIFWLKTSVPYFEWVLWGWWAQFEDCELVKDYEIDTHTEQGTGGAYTTFPCYNLCLPLPLPPWFCKHNQLNTWVIFYQLYANSILQTTLLLESTAIVHLLFVLLESICGGGCIFCKVWPLILHPAHKWVELSSEVVQY